MVDGNLIAFQDAGEDFPAQGQPVGYVQTAIQVLPDIIDYLSGLVVNGSEGRFLAGQEPVDSGCNDMEPVFQDTDERQEYPAGYPQAGNQEQAGLPFVSVCVESHLLMGYKDK